MVFSRGNNFDKSHRQSRVWLLNFTILSREYLISAQIVIICGKITCAAKEFLRSFIEIVEIYLGKLDNVMDTC